MTEYKIFYDTRGDVGKYVEEYVRLHPRISKSFILTPRPNQMIDKIAIPDGDITKSSLIEYKLSDLKSSLYDNSLEDELGRYKVFADKVDADYIYLIGVIITDPSVDVRQRTTLKDLAILNSLMNKKFPFVRYSTVFSPLKAIEKGFNLIRNPPSKTFEYIPQIIRSKQPKGFGLSISALIPRCSPKLGLYIAERWHKDMTFDELRAIVNEFYNDDKDRVKLAEDIFGGIYNTYFRIND